MIDLSVDLFMNDTVVFYSCHLFQVGSWSTETGLDIKDIVWPDNSHVPPPGVPEKFHIKITFLEEPPFIIVTDPDPITGEIERLAKTKLG